LDVTPKLQATKANIGKRDDIKLKNFCAAKETRVKGMIYSIYWKNLCKCHNTTIKKKKRVERQSLRWEKIIGNHIVSRIGLIPGIYEELL
jgi:hypothetical protein